MKVLYHVGRPSRLASFLATALLALVVAVLVLVMGCQQGPGLSPEQAIEHYVAAQRLGDEKALAELAKAVEADPTCSVAHTAIGDIQRRHGNYDLARRAYEAACLANPYFFRPHYNLGVTYQSLAETAKSADSYDDFLRKACDVYLRAITIQSADYDANLNLSACYFQLGKYNQAEQYCQTAIKLQPGKPEGYTNLGIIYDSQNKLYEAVKAYKASLEIETKQPKLLLNLGSTLMRQGRLDQALTAFREASKLEPKSSAPWEQMGSCQFRMNNVDKATEAYQKALELNSKSADAYRGLGVIYMTQFLADQSRATLRDKALSAWNSSLDINPNQDDLKALVQKYTLRTTQPSL